MSRSPVPVAAGALALVVLGMVAAGCGNRGGHPGASATASTARSSVPCKLTRAQRRGLARVRADIRRLRRIETRMQTFSQRGGPNQNVVTGDFVMDLGSAKLPLKMYSRLVHEAKAAVRLCGDCSQGLETVEPVLGTRTHPRCG